MYELHKISLQDISKTFHGQFSQMFWSTSITPHKNTLGDLILQNILSNLKLKKKPLSVSEKVQVETLLNYTIPTHPFSHPLSSN